MKKLVLDIETQNTFQDVGSNNPADLDISIVCIYDYETGTYDSFLQEDLPRLWPILDDAEVLITYHGDKFDIPLLNKYYAKQTGGDLTQIRSLDVLREIKNAYGRMPKLDKVAEGTFGKGKEDGHFGLDAIVWWRNGDIESLRKYCIDDVRITKDVYEYALKNKKLFFKEGPFVKEIKLDTKHWDPLPELKTGSLF